MFSGLPNGSFYDPGKDYSYHGNYGWGTGNSEAGPWEDLGWIAGEQNHPGSWTHALGELGFTGQGNKDVWARDQLGNAERGYGAAQLDELNLQWQDYLKGLDLDTMWNQQSGSSKGENLSQYSNARFQRRQ